ncbi:type IV toxin-antitoxin system AbiEi family antitoxin domain-containing protein [Rhodohalobacter halophilus]|uniref:type IV toxin-antitoxin system AbiEi family antitoxin domain-containing protein n=1 Tax=Rhodohalobacter halophilus TaxID=1812810 RepID=UPI00083FCE07|nr:type IV toxin-antitoxin system AbiEi family antitoxin domain-containing protein [Rhodohalobacter halophilus]
MYVSTDKIEDAIEIFKEHEGVMRTAEALDAGIYPRTLYYMRDEGYLTQLERGVYQLQDSEPLSNPDFVVISRKIPDAVICLISALDLHEMTDEIPHKVHIALPRTSRNPSLDYPPVNVYRFSEETLTAGVETKQFDGISVKVFNPAKTIADCFKFRNQIGHDVAIEALKRGINERKATLADIFEYSEMCRVKNVIQPYIDAIAY